MILVVHNRYRVTGGEERVVADLAWLARERLGEDVAILRRDSARAGRARAAAGLLGGGLAPARVAGAVRATGARVVHAHNLWPSFGPRALEAARAAGARVVLHLHNYRLVCAVGTCFDRRGEDCTRCHGRDTRPGVRLNCRGTGPEAAVYGAGLALWQRRLVAAADAVVVPSAAALERLLELGAPLESTRIHVVGHVVRAFAERSAAAGGTHALVVGRLAREKGVDLAIDACARAGLPLVVAGDGPLRPELEAHARAAGGDVRFAGRVDDAELARLRATAALAIVPSRSAETFGLAAAEAMAAGVPVVATAMGALPELVGPAGIVPPRDAAALADAARRRWGDAAAGELGLARVRAACAPDAVAARLGAVYRGEPPGAGWERPAGTR
ncbi:MAG TPA: glycosyltransferase [Solirubrobacteraceae bacterium]|nr:glycosyltransferase [Solirubrobacteraceae bacterium]